MGGDKPRPYTTQADCKHDTTQIATYCDSLVAERAVLSVTCLWESPLRKARRREEGLASGVSVPADGASIGLQERWVYSSAPTFISACVAVTGHVIVSDGDHTLCGLSPNGKLLFTKRFDDKISAFRLSRDGGWVLVSFLNRILTLLDSAGVALWVRRYPHHIAAFDIRISDEAIVVGGPARTLAVLDRNGEFVNSLQIAAPIEFIEISADEKLVLVGNSDAFIGMVSCDLEVLWMRKLTTISSVPRFSPCNQWITLPAFGMGAYLFDGEGRDAQVFRLRRPIGFAACVDDCRVVALGTTVGELLLVRRDGRTDSKYELPFRPKSWTIDADGRHVVIADRLGSVYGYELTSGESSRFTFLEHSPDEAEPVEKRPLFGAKLFSRASSRHSAQIRVLPGGKHTICATTDGHILSFDEKGRPREIASLGSTVFSLCLASRSYCFAATTEGYLHAFAHDKMLWRRRIGTAMLAVNAIGNRFATMDTGGNICVFDSEGRLVRTWMDSSDARYFLISPSGEDMVVAEAKRAVVVDFKGKGVFEVEFGAGGCRLALDDGSLYVGDARGVVSAFDLVGEQLWSVSVKEPITKLRPFEDGLFCRTASKAAFLIGQDGKIAWRKELANERSMVARNQQREFIEVFRRQRALLCVALGGGLLWKVNLKGAHRSLSVDASGEFIGAFDGAYAWLFAVSDFEPSEPGRFDYLEL